MKKVFDEMTRLSSDNPKTALGIIAVLILALTPNAMFINFDNSEDAFFPDNETVRLLNEVEDEYQASIDFIRFIYNIDSGDLYEEETWKQLAILEAILLENPDLDEYQYPLFGIQANSGMASAAIQWQNLQDEELASDWITEINSAITGVANSNNSTLQSNLDILSESSNSIPSPKVITAEELRAWEPGTPTEWLNRLDTGNNLIVELELMMGDLNALMQGENAVQIAAVSGPISGKLGMLMGLQSIDYRSMMVSNLPADDESKPWDSDGPVLTTFVVVTEPGVHGEEVIGDVQEKITIWAEELQKQADSEMEESDVTVFSFSQLATGQNANLGKELGILNSLCLLLLGFILWTKFRSLRDTASVLTLTVLAILATYGMAGLLTNLGVNMVFNAAMNSVPILLLAIGVDYGLHVVARIREELQDEEKRNPQDRKTLRDFSIEARRAAIRKGTILTSAALMVAIFTDMVGFLSFRLSSQNFLVVFGTVIAVGLFFIYILSITVLPALLTVLKPQKITVAKSVKVEESKFSIWSGKQALNPMTVVVAALLLSLPVGAGITQLEIGFDFRDQLDEDIPVVANFLILSDEFSGQNQPPLYVVLNIDVFSEEGKNAYINSMSILDAEPSITDQTGVWEILELESARDSELREILDSLDTANPEWLLLENWVDANQNLTFRYLRCP